MNKYGGVTMTESWDSIYNLKGELVKAFQTRSM